MHKQKKQRQRETLKHKKGRHVHTLKHGNNRASDSSVEELSTVRMKAHKGFGPDPNWKDCKDADRHRITGITSVIQNLQEVHEAPNTISFRPRF